MVTSRPQVFHLSFWQCVYLDSLYLSLYHSHFICTYSLSLLSISPHSPFSPYLSLCLDTHTHTWSPLEHLLLWELGFTNITSYYQQVSINNITHTLFATRHTGLSAQHVEDCNYQRSAAKSTTLCKMCSVPVGKEHILKKLDVKIINGTKCEIE